jgi:hypothetical protein
MVCCLLLFCFPRPCSFTQRNRCLKRRELTPNADNSTTPAPGTPGVPVSGETTSGRATRRSERREFLQAGGAGLGSSRVPVLPFSLAPRSLIIPSLDCDCGPLIKGPHDNPSSSDDFDQKWKQFPFQRGVIRNMGGFSRSGCGYVAVPRMLTDSVFANSEHENSHEVAGLQEPRSSERILWPPEMD